MMTDTLQTQRHRLLHSMRFRLIYYSDVDIWLIVVIIFLIRKVHFFLLVTRKLRVNRVSFPRSEKMVAQDVLGRFQPFQQSSAIANRVGERIGAGETGENGRGVADQQRRIRPPKSARSSCWADFLVILLPEIFDKNIIIYENDVALSIGQWWIWLDMAAKG